MSSQQLNTANNRIISLSGWESESCDNTIRSIVSSCLFPDEYGTILGNVLSDRFTAKWFCKDESVLMIAEDASLPDVILSLANKLYIGHLLENRK